MDRAETPGARWQVRLGVEVESCSVSVMLSGYYGNYGMAGMGGSNSGSWYRSSQPGWMGCWGYPGAGPLSPGAGK